LTELTFAQQNQTLLIRGKLQTNIEAYGVIAYTDPEGKSDYDALTWISQVTDGAFTIETGKHRPGNHQLRLTVCHVNGATSNFRLSYRANEKGEPDADRLNGDWLVKQAQRAYMQGHTEFAAELARAALPQAAKTPAEKKLKHLLALAAGQTPVDPAQVTNDKAFVSDFIWINAEVGWGKPCRNQYYFDNRIQNALFLELNGIFYEKGLYAHAPSRYGFKLHKKWNTFEATAGLQTGTPPDGSAVFIVKGDGKELYRSDMLRQNQTVNIKVGIKKVDILELLVESGKSGNSFCWSVWASPQVSH
jgi:hypothetical protein